MTECEKHKRWKDCNKYKAPPSNCRWKKVKESDTKKCVQISPSRSRKTVSKQAKGEGILSISQSIVQNENKVIRQTSFIRSL